MTGPAGLLLVLAAQVVPGDTLPVIPRPVAIEHAGGRILLGPGPVRIAREGGALRGAAGDYAAAALHDDTGLDVVLAASGTQALVRFRRAAHLPDEGYRLTVTTEGVEVAAKDDAADLWAVQTLRQLLRRGNDGWELPSVRIEDHPRFRYRGLHLDVGRHFQPVPQIERLLDLMARYKLNIFHWHLTEDQGWRIQIRSRPRLTQVGAWRRETVQGRQLDPYVGDNVPHGGFYSQDDVRHVVAYAAARGITIVPEIEMPGHALAAIASYPELACTPGPFAVGTTWGVFEDILCPGEPTFQFLEDVLGEVLELFPGPWIHIGGDEAPKRRWRESVLAQDVMRREGLRDENELQSWFIRRIERFLSSRGRRLVGWDEILEGGLAPGATVMSWRGVSGGIEAARHGHDVIMTPTSHLYFDYYQGDPRWEPLAIGGLVPLDRVYGFEPVPDALAPEQARHILGAQGNVWTEYLKTPEAVQYMILPRMLALAEVVWSPREARDWDDFTGRLASHFGWFDRTGYHYRIPDVAGLGSDELSLDREVEVRLGAAIAGAEVHYTLDGSVPDAASARYSAPLHLAVDDSGTVVTARVVLPDGRMGAPRVARYRHAVLRAGDADPGGLRDGVRFAYHEQSVTSVDSLGGEPVRQGITDGIALADTDRPERFGYVFEGWLEVPVDGIYTFHLTSDDGSRLTIGGMTVVDHDGLHGADTRTGQAALSAGLHPLSVRYFQAGGGKALDLQVVAPGGTSPEPLTPWLRAR